MKRFASVLVAGIALMALSSESFAGANANAKIQIHLTPVITKNPCPAGRVACQSIVTRRDGLYIPGTGGLYHHAYVLVTDGNQAAGISGAQFGISYGSGAADGAGIDVIWTLCGTLEFPSPVPAWPNSGGGNLVTISPCTQVEPGGAGTGVVAVLGYFKVAAYSPGCISITPRPVDNEGKVADCDANEDTVTNAPGSPSHFGQGCINTGTGYNPCGLITPVENTTWSGIKSRF